jgi:hypothetical protein
MMVGVLTSKATHLEVLQPLLIVDQQIFSGQIEKPWSPRLSVNERAYIYLKSLNNGRTDGAGWGEIGEADTKAELQGLSPHTEG